MIIDRRPFWLIGAAIGLGILAYCFFFIPRVTPEQRVEEQLSILAREPWTKIRVEGLQFVGSAEDPEQVLLRGVRVADGTPVLVHFVARSPYTSPTAIRRLTEQPLEGRTADVLMLPRSLTQEPYQSQFQPQATHAGVALFAGFPDRPVTASSDPSGQALPSGRNPAASSDG